MIRGALKCKPISEPSRQGVKRNAQKRGKKRKNLEGNRSRPIHPPNGLYEETLAINPSSTQTRKP